jgi:uncharacterized repeat protein (TIGR04052 family)
MNRIPFLPTATLTALATATLLAACGGGGDDGPVAVALEFGAVNGSTPVTCDQRLTALGTTAVDAQIKDLRFYVSNVAMIRGDGTRVPLALGANDDWNHTAADGNRLTLVDLEDATGSCAAGTPATNAFVRGSVPAGRYVGVEFSVGVPSSLNHSDYATAIKPLDIQAMAWSWQSGRKFAKVEVTDPDGVEGGWVSKTFNVHLGSTGCTGNPATGEIVACAASNRMAVSFPSFNPSTQKIVLDIQALTAGNDITVNQAGAPGCMSGGTDPECAAVFQTLGIGWAADGTGSGEPVSGTAQTLLKLVSK